METFVQACLQMSEHYFLSSLFFLGKQLSFIGNNKAVLVWVHSHASKNI